MEEKKEKGSATFLTEMATVVVTVAVTLVLAITLHNTGRILSKVERIEAVLFPPTKEEKEAAKMATEDCRQLAECLSLSCESGKKDKLEECILLLVKKRDAVRECKIPSGGWFIKIFGVEDARDKVEELRDCL